MSNATERGDFFSFAPEDGGEEPPRAQVVDLMEALRESLVPKKPGKPGKPGRPPKGEVKLVRVAVYLEPEVKEGIDTLVSLGLAKSRGEFISAAAEEKLSSLSEDD